MFLGNQFLERKMNSEITRFGKRIVLMRVVALQLVNARRKSTPWCATPTVFGHVSIKGMAWYGQKDKFKNEWKAKCTLWQNETKNFAVEQSILLNMDHPIS